jgi:PAS domain S-box-containing protein
MEDQGKTKTQFTHEVEKRTAELLKINEQLKREIEERKRTQKALGEQKDFLNTLLETISNPVFYKDTRGRYIGCNKAFESFTGRLRSDIVGKTVYDMGPREIADKYYEKDLELFEKPGKQRYEWKIENPDGVVRDVIFDKATLKDTSGHAVGLIGVISDITERKRSEEAFRELSQMLLNAQENERKMISYELHDSIAQSLSSLKIGCDTFFDNQSTISHELKEKMVKKSELIGQVIRAVRDLSYGLHPPSLNQMGIIQTISQLCEDFSETTGLVVDFTPTGMSGLKPDERMGINLYRLVQEGLNNVRKHAYADHVSINLIASHPNIILRIKDDGKGFDVKARKAAFDGEKKMGLRSMAERVGLLQGRMKIKSAPLQGTKIIIKIPFTKGKGNDGSKNTRHNN